MSDRWLGPRNARTFSTFFSGFWLSTRTALRCTPGLGRVPGGGAPFCLGLMSKAALVTFPFTFFLWLLDVWPLRAPQWPRTIGEGSAFRAFGGASVVTYLVQGSAEIPCRQSPTTGSECFSRYHHYNRTMFWPRGCGLYPYRRRSGLQPQACIRGCSGDLVRAIRWCGLAPISAVGCSGI